jgi:hypothetical protein
MTLNLNTGGGNFLPILKYNAKAGRWLKRDAQGDEFVDNEVANMTAIFDLENIETGWLHFAPATGPEFVADPDLSNAGPRPDNSFKRGFCLKVFSEKNLDGAREVLSNSISLNRAILALYDHYENSPNKDDDNRLPVVTCTGVEAFTGKHGTNYEPTLDIVGWEARPDALKEDAVDATPATPAAPPPPVQAAPPLPAPAAPSSPVQPASQIATPEY